MNQTTNTTASIDLAQLDKLGGAVKMVVNMLMRDNTPIRIEAAGALIAAYGEVTELARHASHGAAAQPAVDCPSCGRSPGDRCDECEDCPVHGAAAPTCPACQGNDKNMPCAYPSKGMQGCLRDERLSAGAAAPSAEQAAKASDARYSQGYSDGWSEGRADLSAGAAAKTEQASKASIATDREFNRLWQECWSAGIGEEADATNALIDYIDSLITGPSASAAGAGSEQGLLAEVLTLAETGMCHGLLADDYCSQIVAKIKESGAAGAKTELAQQGAAQATSASASGKAAAVDGQGGAA